MKHINGTIIVNKWQMHLDKEWQTLEKDEKRNRIGRGLFGGWMAVSPLREHWKGGGFYEGNTRD